MGLVFLCRRFELWLTAAAVAVAAHRDGHGHAASAASVAGAIFIVAFLGMLLIWRWNAEGIVEIPADESFNL